MKCLLVVLPIDYIDGPPNLMETNKIYQDMRYWNCDKHLAVDWSVYEVGKSHVVE